MVSRDQINKIAFIAMITGVIGMIFSATKLGAHNLEDVNGGGFVLVAGVLLFGIGLFALLFNAKK